MKYMKYMKYIKKTQIHQMTVSLSNMSINRTVCLDDVYTYENVHRNLITMSIFYSNRNYFI